MGKRIKLRSKVDLNKLKDFDFKYLEDEHCWFKKVYMCNDNDDRVCYRIDEADRIIQITRLDGELDATLYDLISNNLTEIDFKKNNEILRY